MSKPSDIDPADLWAQITALPRAHRVVPFPRDGEDGQPIGEVAIWVLHQEERSAATLAAEKKVRALMKDSMPQRGESSLGYDALFEDRATVEILYRACRKVGAIERPAFPSPDELAKRLTGDELAVLMRSYIRVQAELGPITADLSQDEVDAWVEVLATGGRRHPFDLLSTGGLLHLLRSMASRVWMSQTAKV